MKKSLFLMAAASALMLTACTSESDVLQSATKQEAPKAVGFDVYTQDVTNVTRAGQEGTMTTERIQRSQQMGGGFGVYAFKTEDTDETGADVKYMSAASNVPNFMVNEKILWDATSMGWYYSPIKYWPNETDNDSQEKPATMNGTNNHTDRLTFFAYAPYVTDDQANGEGTGIIQVSGADGKLGEDATLTDPAVKYKAVLTNPNDGVDLLWGVAPAGGLNYTAVNGNSVTSPEGMPLLNMIKPNVNTNMKFLFQHALARLNIKAVAAVDQLSAGGTLDPNTRITINKITLTGYFGDNGVLNLNNTVKDEANWVSLNEKVISSTSAVGGEGYPQKTITITANATGTPAPYNGIAEHLRFKGTHDSPSPQEDRVGVTTVLQNVLEPVVPSTEKPWSSSKLYTTAFPYSETTPYYTNELCTDKATANIVGPTSPAALFTKTSKGEYVSSSVSELQYPKVNEYYEVTFKKVGAGEGEITEAAAAGYLAYKKTTNTVPDPDVDTYTPQIVGKAPAAGEYVITETVKKATFNYPVGESGTRYYTRDASYYMVVPTYNAGKAHSSIDEALRTITVTIEYYITTEDSRLSAGRTQTKNVVKKDVVFPSLKNGKSYNLNLILGLTSVKMEAEVDDWKVENVNGYLPQNTAE